MVPILNIRWPSREAVFGAYARFCRYVVCSTLCGNSYVFGALLHKLTSKVPHRAFLAIASWCLSYDVIAPAVPVLVDGGLCLLVTLVTGAGWARDGAVAHLLGSVWYARVPLPGEALNWFVVGVALARE